MKRDTDMVKLVRVVQTGLGLKELPKSPLTQVVQGGTLRTRAVRGGDVLKGRLCSDFILFVIFVIFVFSR